MNIVEYAKQHRYRLRDLNRGGPCPPAMWKRPKGYPKNRKADEAWAIVGRDGYVADEGQDRWLGIALFYKSSRGVKKASARIAALGGSVMQVGDTEIAGRIPVQGIEDGLTLIRVSKVRPGGPGQANFGQKSLAQNTSSAQDQRNEPGGPQTGAKSATGL